MSYQQFKEKARWLGLVSSGIFLIINIYLRVKFVFDSGEFAGRLVLIAFLAALTTLALGIVSCPRWQSFISLGVFAYALYWALFMRLYGIS